MHVSKKIIAIDNYKEITAKQAEFRTIENFFELYCTVGDELYTIAKRLEGKDP